MREYKSLYNKNWQVRRSCHLCNLSVSRSTWMVRMVGRQYDNYQTSFSTCPWTRTYAWATLPASMLSRAFRCKEHKHQLASASIVPCHLQLAHLPAAPAGISEVLRTQSLHSQTPTPNPMHECGISWTFSASPPRCNTYVYASSLPHSQPASQPVSLAQPHTPLSDFVTSWLNG